MLNHEQKFNLIGTDYQDSDITLSTAYPIQSPEDRVTIVKLNKSNLPAPLEAEHIMRGLHWLKYLEEDSENWYVINQKFSGTLLFSDSAVYSSTDGALHSSHFQQFLALVAAYDHLPYGYQYLLLDCSQFIITDNALVSNELLDLRLLSDVVNEFTPIRKKFIRIVSHLIAQLIYTEPETYHLVNWTPLYDSSESLTSLGQLSMYWLSELEKIQNRVKPTPLEALYVVEAQDAQTPAALRRQKEAMQQSAIASLQASLKSKPAHWNPAIIATLLIALIMTCIFVIPNLLDKLGKSSTPPAPATVEKAPPAVTPAVSANTDKAVDPLEKLPVNQIDLKTANWTYDTTRFHTGDRSLKLILNAGTPSGNLLLNDIALGKNTSLTLWMMSDTVGSTQLKITFFHNDQPIHTVDYAAVFDADNVWYMMSPEISDTNKDLSKVNRMLLEISGSPQTIWLDDLSLESYK